MNMKSPQNIMLSPNPRPSNEQKQVLNYANTHQGYNIQLSKQNNQVINIPKVNFQKNL